MQSDQNTAARRSPRRFIKILLVLAVLAAAGLWWTNRPHPSPGGSGAQNDVMQKYTPTTSGGPVYNAVCSGTIKMHTAGTLKDSDFTEVSGITASRQADDVYWVHNDSGDTARIFAVASSGKLLGIFELPGVTAIDWEDIASGPGPISGTPYIYVSDTGDNHLRRSDVALYRFPEPMVGSDGQTQAVAGVDKLTFTYPDGTAHNTESAFVDPVSGKIYLIDKSDTRPSQIFEAPAGLSDGSRTVLTKVGDLAENPAGAYELITAADISPSGDTIAVRTYQHMYVYNRPSGSTVAQALAGKPCVMPKFSEDHGEAVAFMRDGTGLVTTSEGANEPIHTFVPKL